MSCKLYNEILARQDAEQAVNLSRFFKTGEGQYGEGKSPLSKTWKSASLPNTTRCASLHCLL